MGNTTRQILALREAGEVERAHGTPHHGEYSVAKHSYNMACMAMVLYPGPIHHRARVIEAILMHDFAERWTGDLPAPVKWEFPELKKSLEKATEATHDAFDLERPDLSEKDRWFVKSLDIGELYLWCCDQLRLGNQNINQFRDTCTRWVSEHRAHMPAEFMEFWISIHHDLQNNYARLEDIPWNK